MDPVDIYSPSTGADKLASVGTNSKYPPPLEWQLLRACPFSNDELIMVLVNLNKDFVTTLLSKLYDTLKH